MATFDFGTAGVKVKAIFDSFRGDVVKEATAAGEAGGKAATEGAKKELKLGSVIAKGFGTAVAGAFGVAAARGLELEKVTARVRAETGLTGDAAVKAGEAINRMSGTNIQGLEEIGSTLSKVHTDLGLTGDAAEKATQDFLTFARASGQDAAGAVSAFDDILDGFDLTAKDSAGIMDQLIASHQKYGGSVEASQAALAAMAPALKAMNLGLDDGVGLLNLFATSGISAGDAAGLLNKAVKNLKPGQDLNDLVAQLGQIEDPTLRAQKAIELFGKSGAKIANAINPGTRSIDGFIIRAKDVPAATEDARAALDSTFGAQVQLKIKEFGSTITSVLGQGGPVLSALASIGSLAAGLGLDDLVRKIGPGLVGAMKSVGRQGAEALSEGFQAVLSGAQGTVLGNFVASRIENIADPTKSTVVGNAWRAAAAKGAAVYAAALAASSAIAGAFASAINKIPGSAAVRGAITSAGTQMGALQGTVMGTAAGVAFRLAFLGAIVALAPEIKKQAQAIGVTIHDAIFDNDLLRGAGDFLESAGAALSDLPWPLGPKGAPDWATFSGEAAAGGENIGKAFTGGFAKAVGAMDPANIIAEHRANTEAAVKAFVSDLDTVFSEAVDQGSNFGALTDAADGAVTNTVTALAKLPPIARRLGFDTLQKIADGVNAARQIPLDAFQALVEAMKHPLSETAETARLLGELASKQLAAGLASGDPAIRFQARATKAAIIERLEELAPETGTLSKKAMVSLEAGLKSKDADIRAAAQGIATIVEAQLALKDAKLWAQHAADAYAAGLASKENAIAVAASAALRGAKSVFAAASPPGPDSPLHEIDKWGERTGLAWVDGFIKALGEAPDKIKDKLGWVQKAFAEFVKNYNPIGNLLGGLTPEADRANLTSYIASLRAALPKETDPVKRLEILQKILEYESRLADLQGQTATKSEKAAETIQGYISNLDKALLTATDPARIKKLTDELLVYLARLDAILHPKTDATPATPTAAVGIGRMDQPWSKPANPTATPMAYTPTDYYPLIRAAGLTSVGTQAEDAWNAAGTGPPGGTTIIVNNPTAEPASRSVVDSLKLASAFPR